MINWIRQDRPPWIGYGVAIILSLLCSCYLFSWNFLQGNVAFFEKGDPGQHVTGWFFYEQDTWNLPLTYTHRLNYPEGVSIALTDSIPLAAIFFKFFRRWLPEGFHYFGWWHLFAYLLQSVSAVLLIRVLGYRSLLAAAAAAGFALLMPVFTWRYGHTALLTQGFILLAFSIYFLGIKENKSLLRNVYEITPANSIPSWAYLCRFCFQEKRLHRMTMRALFLETKPANLNPIWALFTGVISYTFLLNASIFVLFSIVALLVHPYLFAMTYPIYLAFLIDWGLRQKKWLVCLFAFLGSVLILGFSFYLLGYLDIHGANGFNLFSMNLLSPICGGKFSIPCFYIKNDHFESFNYLGLGLIIILLIVLFTQSKWLLQIPLRYPGLFAILLLFFWFSLSNVVYFGNQKIFTLKLSQKLINFAAVFRSSGRFFWPVGYALLFVGLTGILRWKKHVLATSCLIICLFIQVLDTGILLRTQKLDILKPAQHPIEKWYALADDLQAIDIFPQFQRYDEHKTYRFENFLLLAARKKLLCNTAEIAHPPPALSHYSKDFILSKDHLYIIMPEITSADVPIQLAMLLHQGDCRNFYLEDNSIATACVPGKTDAWWRKKAPFMWKIAFT